MKEIYLNESDEKITTNEIEAFETEIGMVFPLDFKNFYLKSNGGYPEKELYTGPFLEKNPNTGDVFEQDTDVDKFFSLNEIKFEYGDILDEEYIPNAYVPFARTSFGNLLLIRIDECDLYGHIFFSNHDLFDSNINQFTITMVCNSFDEFIDRLEEE